MLTIDDHIATYLAAIEVEGKTLKTQKSYASSLADFRRIGIELGFPDLPEEYTVSPHGEDSDPEAAIPTVEVPSVSEDMGVSGLSGQTESDAALVEVGSDESMETEAFELMDESGETDGVAVAEGGKPGGSQRASRRNMSQSARMRSLEVQQKQGHAVWTSFLLIGILVASLQGSIQYSEILGTSPKWTNDITGPLRDMVEGVYTAFN